MHTNQFPGLTDDLICIVNSQGQVLESNANWKNTIIATALHQLKLLDLIEDEMSRDLLKTFFNDIHQNAMRIESCRMKDSCGNMRWFDFRIKKIASQNSYSCTFRDITRKKVVHSVLDQLCDVFSVGHWEYNSINNSFNCCSKSAQILGEDSNDDKIIFEKLISLIAPEGIHQLDFDSGKLEIITNTHDDKWLRILGRKEVFTDGEFQIQGLIQDYTFEKKREIAQLGSNIELSSFEKGLDQFSIVARTDAKGRIIFANEEFCRISKYSSAELIGKDHRILNSGFHPKEFFKDMWDCIHSGRSWRGEIKNKAKDGNLYWVDTIIVPIFNSSQELEEILSFRYEITLLKKLQEENQELRNQLEALKKTLS